MYEIPPKTQSEVGQDNNWVVGGVTCCNILDNLLKKEKHLFLMHLFLFFLEALMGSPGIASV